MSFIEVNEVSKQFMIYPKVKGFWPNVQSFFKREGQVKETVRDISFSIEVGENVAFIGPNGAGKSTTIKMLSGILQPTNGRIMVGGLVPYEERKQNSLRMGVVFGQRSQLYWDLAMTDTFDLYKRMYQIPEKTYKRNVEFYIELLEMQSFLNQPVRQLSLGQKMRANLAVALLHDPEVVYLDEPTIGLDIIAKTRIRTFLREVNRDKKFTLMLTTHDMDDIEQICDRIILIDQGSLVYDGALVGFKQQFAAGHRLTVELEDDQFVITDDRLTLVQEEPGKRTVQFRKEQIPVTEVIQIVTTGNQVVDLQLIEPSIEDIVKSIYEKKEVVGVS